ncbi:ATP-dependent DNA ligase [Clavulina sp. PMI_390]|nr:ATP-dependent DNA ligase [Clavulina sp. PMI_390]
MPEPNQPGIERPAALAPRGPSPPFYRLVALFEWCSKKKLELRRRYLASWFDNWRNFVGPDLYPVMRLLLPQKDRERATYGFKEATLAKAFISSFGMSERSPDGQSLIHWKRPEENTQKAVGDFPSVLFQVINARSSVMQGTLTIEQVNNLLDDLSSSFRVSGKALIDRVFKTFAQECTANEIRWIVRIILKDLNIGMKENTVFGVFHPDATDLYNSCSNLQKICYDLHDPKHRLNASDKCVTLFQPFQPMLCGRTGATAESVKLMLADKNDKGFIMEEKLDGERIQLHKRGNEFFLCSRHIGKDYTYLYGNSYDTGSLIPYIQDAFHPMLQDLVLDGEMMVWDPEVEKYLPFGNLKTSALDKTPGPGRPHPCFKIFDVLYLKLKGAKNPTILTERTLAVRLGALKDEITGPNGKRTRLFREIPGRLEFALQRIGKTQKDVEAFLQEVVEERGEGLVLKRHLSPYVLGGRDNTQWVKVKPEYMDDMGESVDVIVLAGEYGRGRRGGRISSLICGVRAEHLREDANEATYQTFCRVGTGLNFEEYDWINKKPWKKLNKNKFPDWMSVSPIGTDDKGDVYLLPEDSFILSVKAASINSTEQYGCGQTLRFPRCKGIRHDLTVDDCLTKAKGMFIAFAPARMRLNHHVCGFSPAKKRKTIVQKRAIVSSAHKGADLEDIEKQSSLFEDMKFFVTAGSVRHPSHSLVPLFISRRIHENGGTYSQLKSTEGAYIIYGGIDDTLPVVNIKKKGEQDIIKAEWIQDSIAAGTVLPLAKRFFHYATEQRQSDLDYLSGETTSMDVDDEGEPTEDEDEEDAKPSKFLSAHRASSSKRALIDDDEDDDSELPNDVTSLEWILAGRNSYDDTKDSWNTEVKYEDVGDFGDGSATESEADEDDYDFIDGHDAQSQNLIQGGAGRGSPETVGDNNGDLEMGEDSAAHTYDPDRLFRHLVFYLDSPKNAETHGMGVSAKPGVREAAEKEFARIERLICENGGIVTSNLAEGKLTHVVLFKRDITRRVALMRMTSIPKRRHLVLTSFVSGCVDEECLLDEDAFAP